MNEENMKEEGIAKPSRPAENLFSALVRTIARNPAQSLLVDPVSGERWARAEFAAKAGRLGSELTQRGVGRNHAVGILMGNRLEFFQIDMAVLLAGGTPVSLYPTSSPPQIADVLEHSDIRLVFVDRARADMVRQALGLLRNKQAVTIVELDAPTGETAPATVRFEDLCRRDLAPIALEQRALEATPQDRLTLIYTSGTTGQPKAAELTHGNFLAAVQMLQAGLDLRDTDRVISWLPHAHVAERTCHYYAALVVGFEVHMCADSQGLAGLLRQVEPNWFGAVPRFWEKLMAGAKLQLDGLPAAQRAVVEQAMADRLALHRMQEAGAQPAAQLLNAAQAMDARVLRPLREKLGLANARTLITGSAPTPRPVLEFFAALGHPLQQIYGATETCMCASLERPGASRLGSVGKPTPGTGLRIAADDEVQVRGPQVFASYWGRPESTREAIDPQGWYSTGDLGRIDEDGFLWITGRKKDLIINSSGQNMSPQKIEATLCEHSPAIAHALVVGDARPFNSALLVVNPAEHGGAELRAELEGALCEAVAAANEQLARVEQIKRFRVVFGTWLPGGEELTPTMKLRRVQVLRKYAPEIDTMYAVDMPPGVLQPGRRA